jgi:2,3-bisphosphoglycerate-dependent phosphoglycerate mutase
MQSLSIKPILFKLLFICLVLCNYNASAQKTTIWLVRHAEKESTPGDDPGLSKLGLQRSKDLAKALKHENIAGIYVTPFQRTQLTAKPTAAKFTTVPQVYNTTDYKSFALKIFQYYTGQNVLIVGHSNTIIPIIAAICGERPFTELADDDYDLLFKITVKNRKAEVEISYYGAPHHSTLIPESYAHDLNNHFMAPSGRF